MQATVVASTLVMLSLLFPPVSILSSGAVALVTLRLGAYEGFLVLLFASIASAVLGLLLFGAYHFSLLYGLVLWLPIWLIAIVLREGRQLTLAIEIAVLLGVVLVIGFYLYNHNPIAMWQGVVEQILQPIVQKSPTEAGVDKVQQTFAVIARFMTGIVIAGTIYSILFGLFLARWWQSVLYNPGGFRQEYLGLKTEPRLALICIAVIGIAFFPLGVLTQIAQNICVILFVLYTFVGTAVLHSLFDNMSTKRFMVPMLYVTLTLIPHTMILIALLGLADAWLNLRNKQSKQNSV